MNSTKYAGESMKASMTARKPAMAGKPKGGSYTAGAGSAEGRIQKAKAYGKSKGK